MRERFRLMRAERAVSAFAPAQARTHALPGKLILTLTSYPPRFPTLSKTLKSLLMQSIRPDAVILWIARGDAQHLPHQVKELERVGLEIRLCDDIRSYKKVIPALEYFPDAFLVTADDDLYYEPNWLRKLVEGYPGRNDIVVCRRAHRPRCINFEILPYNNWDHDVVTGGAIDACIFPTTGAGALFPPGSLSPEATNEEAFTGLCPHADDVWLFAMALKAGSSFRQVGGGFPQVAWPSSQRTSLMATNLGEAGNDRQLAAVIERYRLQSQICAACGRPERLS